MVYFLTPIKLRTKIACSCVNPIILFPTLTIIFIVWYINALDQAITINNGTVPTATIFVTNTPPTVTLTSTSQKTTEAHIIMPFGRDLIVESYINDTLLRNVKDVNTDVSQRLQPLAESALHNWNNSLFNCRMLLDNTRDSLKNLGNNVVYNLKSQAERINSSVEIISEQGLIVASSDQTNALSELYLDYGDIQSEFDALGKALTVSSNIWPLKLPKIDVPFFELNVSVETDWVQSFLSHVDSTLSTPFKDEDGNRLKKRSINPARKYSKFVTISVIFACIYPLLVIIIVILEWFTHTFRERTVLYTVDRQLTDIDDKISTLERHSRWKSTLSGLSETVQSPIITKIYELCLNWGAKFGLLRIKKEYEVYQIAVSNKRLSKLCWWLGNIGVVYCYYLVLLFTVWGVTLSLVDEVTNPSLRERGLDTWKVSHAVSRSNGNIEDLCSSFDLKINSLLSNSIDDFHKAIDNSMRKWNTEMQNISQSLPDSISGYVPWEDFNATGLFSPTFLDVSRVVSELTSSSPTDLLSRNNVAVSKGSPSDITPLKNSIRALFCNSIIAWACALVAHAFLYALV